MTMIPVRTNDRLRTIDDHRRATVEHQLSYFDSPFVRSFPLAAANPQFPNVNPFQQVYEQKQSLTEQDRDASLDSFQTDDQSSKGPFRESLVLGESDVSLQSFPSMSIYPKLNESPRLLSYRLLRQPPPLLPTLVRRPLSLSTLRHQSTIAVGFCWRISSKGIACLS